MAKDLNIQVVEGEGRADSLENAVIWMFGLLSQGKPGEYLESVLKRAEAMEKACNEQAV